MHGLHNAPQVQRLADQARKLRLHQSSLGVVGLPEVASIVDANRNKGLSVRAEASLDGLKPAPNGWG